MADYPRTLVDMTHAPYDLVASRIVDAINYGAAYEDENLHYPLTEILNYWDEYQGEYRTVYERDGFDAANTFTVDGDSDRVDRISEILENHGYSLDVSEDYPGLWVIDTAEV